MRPLGLSGLLLRFGKTLSVIMIVVSYAMEEVAPFNSADLCLLDGIGFTSAQQQMCVEMPASMAAVQETYGIFSEECKTQFHNERWNCSTTAPPVVGETPQDLKRATKETAFVYSLTSASLAYAITRACSEGQIPQCGCDDSTIGVPIDDWVWGGCSDDVQFGINFARDFLDSRQQEGMENKTTKELGVALVSLHNNAVGRTVVDDNVEVNCKCHGVSGSCSAKTCWRQQGDIRKVSDDLHQKFDTAIKVSVLDTLDAPPVLKSVGDENIQPTTDILVYTKKTQDFCTSSASYTNGRECVPTDLLEISKNGMEMQGGAINMDAPLCEELCCHQKFYMSRTVHTSSCNCKFVWCCQIFCETCAQTIDKYYCNAG